VRMGGGFAAIGRQRSSACVGRDFLKS
jgi:hypothetical protein